MKRNALRPIVVLALMVFLFSSCGLFRKKNKCHTCPTWSMEKPVEDRASAKG